MPSNLGPHSLVPNSAAPLLVKAGARVAKLVNDFGAAAEFKEASPGILIIGRRISHYPEDPSREVTAENLRHLAPDVAAEKFVNIQRETYRLNPLIKYWEGPNEPQWDWLNREQARLDMAWYAAFEARRADLLADLGLRAVIGNFSVGIPDIGDNKIDLWEAFLPALRRAHILGGVLGLHEYTAGTLRQGYSDETGEGWLTFRYRKVRRLILAANGLHSLRIVLTEFGTDFRKYEGLNYVAELAWADDELRKDGALATVFTFGTHKKDWEDFNLEGRPEAQGLANHISAIANVPDPAPAPVPPSPPPASTKFKRGDRVRVLVDGLRTRATPSLKGTIVGLHDAGTLATVDGEAVMADGLAWWPLNYDSGPDGFSAEAQGSAVHLEKVTVPEPTPDPTPDPEPEPVPAPDENLIRNGSFESKNWTTFPDGNQQPEHWTLKVYGPGDPPRFPTKLHEGSVVPVGQLKPGECVHKFGGPDIPSNLPPDEWQGGGRALILEGVQTFKLFEGGGGGPCAHELTQTIRAIPGRQVKLIFPVLPETTDVPQSPTGLLERDHWHVMVALGDKSIHLIYAEMLNRQWLPFTVTATVPADGQLTAMLYCQQNWPGRTAFFVDDVRATYVTEPAPVPDPEPADCDELRAELADVKVQLEANEQELEEMTDRLAVHLEIVRRQKEKMESAARKMDEIARDLRTLSNA